MKTLEYFFNQNMSFRLWGLVGNSTIGNHSLAPVVWKHLLNRWKKTTKYFVLGSDSKEYIEKYFNAMKKNPNVVGFNVARPWKELAFNQCDWVEPIAKEMNTVNTIIVKDNKFFGFNTDGIGIVNTIKKERNLSNTTVLLLGAGGAAQTVPYYLTRENVNKIYIVDILEYKAEKITNKYRTSFRNDRIKLVKPRNIKKIIDKVDIIINATPCGMRGYNKEIPLEDDIINLLKPNTFVVEMVYTPFLTPLLEKALLKDCIVIPGINMLVEQASESFKYAFSIPVLNKEKEILISKCAGASK
ncbi:MAG: shikimate dehydrogenase family protein [Candidatus Woesearchaeota archaeon]